MCGKSITQPHILHFIYHNIGNRIDKKLIQQTMKQELIKSYLSLLLALMAMPLLMSANVDVVKGDEGDNDWVKDELLGRVRCVATTALAYLGYEHGEVYTVNLCDSVCYNSEGYRVEEVKYVDDRIQKRVYYEYDADNNLIEMNVVDFGLSVVSATEKDKYSYDDEGRMLEKRTKRHYVSRSEDTLGLYRYSYDDRGRLERDEYINEDGELVAWTLFFYDEKDNLKEVRRLSDGLFNWRQIYTYDDRGNRVNYDWVKGCGSDELLERSYYDYDDEGRKIAEKVFDEKGNVVVEMEYGHDEEGRLIEKRGWDWIEILNGVVSIEYDAFDEQGNWLEKNTYMNDNPMRLVKREIVCF